MNEYCIARIAAETAAKSGACLSSVQGTGCLVQAPGQAVVCQGLLQNVLDGGVDVHGLIRSRSGDWLGLSLSIGHNFFLSAGACHLLMIFQSLTFLKKGIPLTDADMKIQSDCFTASCAPAGFIYFSRHLATSIRQHSNAFFASAHPSDMLVLGRFLPPLSDVLEV